MSCSKNIVRVSLPLHAACRVKCHKPCSGRVMMQPVKCLSAIWTLFGEDYYIELQNTALKISKSKCRASGMGTELRVRTVATNDVHYVAQADAAAQDILLCLQTGRDLDDPSRLRFDSDQYYLKSADEMQQVMEAVDPRIASESLDAAGEIADKCSFELKMEGLLMPHFALPASFDGDADAYLRHLVYAGAKRRYGELSSDIAARLDHELGIISTMGYAGYFLIVQDFTRAARELAVAVGPGRGSAAGSAVAYSLGITNIDPLQYDLALRAISQSRARRYAGH